MTNQNIILGKWAILGANNGTFFIKNDQNLQVCEYIKTQEDARLIAAAPDMYDALKDLLAEYQISDTDGSLYGNKLSEKVSPNWVKAFEVLTAIEKKE